MKYFKDAVGTVYAFEADGSQDEFIPAGLVALSDEEVVAHLNPVTFSTTAAVDSECDRRISDGFEFNGAVYQSRLPDGARSGDWEVFSGKALEALIAVMGGAQPGDLRWSNPAEDFAWIAADNTRVPMDAQTVIELAKAASAHRTRQTFSGSYIKARDPIPGDYTDDKWWQ